MKNFMSNVNAAFDTAGFTESRDRGEIVSLVLTIAGFAVIAILAVNWLGTAVLNKAADAANCIEGSSAYNKTSKESATNCSKTVVNSSTSFKGDDGYKKRY